MSIESFSIISFIDRYLKLSEVFTFGIDDAMSNYSDDEVLKVIEELGYQARYFKKDNFFQIAEISNRLRLHFNIALRGGVVELIWGIWIDGKPQLQLSGPWGVIADNLGYESAIRKPIFRNYEDLKQILKEAFSIYEDFKRELVKTDART